MKLSRNLKNDAFARSSTSVMGFSKMDALAVIAVLTLLLVGLGGYSLMAPSTKNVQAKIPYTQSGTFSYSASVNPNSIYGTSKLATGDPVLLNQVSQLKFGFNYSIAATGTSLLSGTEQLIAVVDDSGITRKIPLQAQPVEISGNTFDAVGTLDMSKLMAVSNAFMNAFAGSAGNEMNVEIVPNVALKGSLSGHPAVMNFNPSLLFSLTNTVLQLSNPASQNSGVVGLDETKSQLTPSSQGTLAYPSVAPGTLPLGWVHPTIMAGRLISLFGLLACLLAAGLILWTIRRSHGDESVIIEARYGPRLVTVEKISFKGSAVVTTQSVAVLITLANKYNTKVLHSVEDGNDRYAVFDNGVLYEYTAPVAENLGSISDPEGDRLTSREVVLDGFATK